MPEDIPIQPELKEKEHSILEEGIFSPNYVRHYPPQLLQMCMGFFV